MGDNSNIKLIYSKIQKQLFYMIPEKWESIYLYASVIEGMYNIETGELFFYYFPKSILQRKPVNSYEIPIKFNLEEEAYLKLAETLYRLIKELRNEMEKNIEEIWTNITIKIEKFHFIVEYYYDNLKADSEVKHLIWSYKNLKFPLEMYNKKEKKVILEYLENEKMQPSKVIVYSEPMYQNPIKNVIQFNRDKTEIERKSQLGNISSKEYTYQRIANKPLRRTKIAREASIQSQYKIEDEIDKQRQKIKSQILNKNI